MVTPHPHQTMLTEWLANTSHVVQHLCDDGSWMGTLFNRTHDIRDLRPHLSYRLAPADEVPEKSTPAAHIPRWMIQQ